MTKSLARRLMALAAVLGVSPWADAHPGHDGDHGLTWDFSAGVSHPFTGVDHMLAMIAVGLWAAQLGGRARWLMPAVFVGLMALGAALAHAGLTIFGVESGIAASVLVFGLLIARSVRLPVAASMALVGVFALFHGLVHGTEMPATSSGFSYGAGFIVATAALHFAGVALGTLAARRSEKIANYAGWGIAAAGVILLAR